MFRKLRKVIRSLRKKNRRAFVSGIETAQQNQQVIHVSNWGYEGTNSVTTNFAPTQGWSGGNVENVKEREEKKPVELVNDIVVAKPSIMLNGLDEQIKIVKRRIKVLEKRGIRPSDEIEALTYLKARKQYLKIGHKFRWAMTTKAMVDKLCEKYKVKCVSFSSFYKTVPTEALDELEAFVDLYEDCRDDEPDLQLIVDDGGKEDRKDPILLANSPFGRWLYILGAWDKEVEIVDDLIYKGK